MDFETALQRAAEQAAQELVKPLQNTLVARRLASINPSMKGEGLTVLDVTHVSDMSGAFIQYNLPSDSDHADSIYTKRELIQVPVLWKQFKVKKADVLAWANRQIAAGEENRLESVAAQAASYTVAEQEEQLLLNGWKPDGTNYAVKGFTQIAGNTISGGSISTVGTMFDYVAQAIGAIEEDNVHGENGSYNLTIPTAIRSTLLGKRYTNGAREMDEIKSLIGSRGDIIASPYLPSGTAVVTPVDTARQHFEYLNPVDYSVEFAAPKYSFSDIEGTVYELMVPHWKRLNASNLCNAVCTITSLSA